MFACQLLSQYSNTIAAPGISGWNLNILNVTEKSFYAQWQGLTNEISQPVKAYIVYVSWQKHYGGYEVTGKIVPSNVTSVTLDGLDAFTDFTVLIFAADVLGNPHKSSITNVKTLEGGEYLSYMILFDLYNWLESCHILLSDYCKSNHG